MKVFFIYIFFALFFIFNLNAATIYSVNTFDSGNPGDNDWIYHATQQISIEVTFNGTPTTNVTCEIISDSTTYDSGLQLMIQTQSGTTYNKYQYKWDTTGRNEGTDYKIIFFWDGTKETYETQLITIDNTKPVVTLVNPANGTKLKAGSYTITIDFSEAMDTAINLNVVFSGNTLSGNWDDSDTWSGTLTIDNSISDGNYTLEVGQGLDLAGNVMDTDESTIYTVDQTPPNLNGGRITDSDIYYINGDNINIEVTGEASLPTVEIDLSNIGGSANAILSEGSSGTYTGTFTVNASSDGTKELLITAYDEAGNTSNLTIEIYVDNTSPTVSSVASNPNDPFILNTLVTFEILFSEEMDTSETITVTFDGNNVNPVSSGWSQEAGIWKKWIGTIEINNNFTDGNKVLSIGGAHDLAGNALNPNPDNSNTFDVDVTKPVVVTVTPSSPKKFSNEVVVFSITFSETMNTGVSPEVIMVDRISNTTEIATDGGWESDNKTWTCEISIDPSVFDDSREISLEIGFASDVAGNIMDTDEANVYITDFNPPVVDTVGVTDATNIYKYGSIVNLYMSAEASLKTVEVDTGYPGGNQIVILTESNSGGANSAYTGNFSIIIQDPNDDGTHEIYFYAYDTVENMTGITYEIILDNTKPEITGPVVITPSNNNYLSTGEITLEVCFYDTSEIWNGGIDLAQTPEITLGGELFNVISFDTREVGGRIIACITAELIIDSSFAGEQTLIIKDLYDIAGNTMEVYSDTYEVIVNRPIVSSLLFGQRSPGFSNWYDVTITNRFGIGEITLEIIFNDSISPNYTPEIRFIQGTTSELFFATSEGFFTTTTVTCDTYITGISTVGLNDGTTDETAGYTNNLITIEISFARDMANNLMITKELVFYRDTIRPTLEVVFYVNNDKRIILGFSEDITAEIIDDATLKLTNYTGGNIFSTNNIQSWQIAGNTLEIILSDNLDDATYEIIVNSDEVGVKDLAFNTIDTSEVSYYKKQFDFKKPIVDTTSVVLSDGTNEIDSINYFLYYHPDDLLHSNADSVEIRFILTEETGLDTDSIKLYWSDEYGGYGNIVSTSNFNISTNGNGTYEIRFFGINLSDSHPNIGKPGVITFWLDILDTSGNPLANAYNNTDEILLTAEVRWLSPVSTVEAEINPRLVLPNENNKQFKVSIAPQFEYYNSGIEKIIISNLPDIPSNVNLRYFDTSWNTVSSFISSISNGVLEIRDFGNWDIEDNIKTIEVSFLVDTKSSIDAPDGSTIEVRVINTTTQRYTDNTINDSAEVLCSPGEVDGIINNPPSPYVIYPNIVKSFLNVQTILSSDPIHAEIIPAFVKPNQNNIEFKYYILPTIDSNNNVGINRIYLNLYGISVVGTTSVSVGGVSYTNVDLFTYEVSSNKSTIEIIFKNNSFINSSDSIEIIFTGDVGNDNLPGVIQEAFVDFVYPGMDYPQIYKMATDGDASGVIGDSDTMTLLIGDIASSTTLEVSPKYILPYYPSYYPDLKASIDFYVPYNTPGIDFIRLCLSTIEVISILDIKVNSTSVSYTELVSQPRTVEIKLDTPITDYTQLNELIIEFKVEPPGNPCTSEIYAWIGNYLNTNDIVSCGTFEIKTGYPLDSTGSATTLEVMINNNPTGYPNVPVNNLVVLRYKATIEVGELNTGIDKLYINKPSYFTLSNIDTIEVDNSSVNFGYSLNSNTIEITLNDPVISTGGTVERTIEIYFSGYTGSTPNETLTFKLYADNSIASSISIFSPDVNLYTRRLISEGKAMVIPNLVSPAIPGTYYNYTAELQLIIDNSEDIGIDRLEISLKNHTNVTISDIKDDTGSLPGLIIGGASASFDSINTSETLIITFNAQADSVLDYPAGELLDIYVDKSDVVAPTLISQVISGGDLNVYITDIVSGGSIEAVSTTGISDSILTLGSKEVVMCTIKPLIPNEYAGFNKIEIGIDNGLDTQWITGEIQFFVDNTEYTKILSGIPGSNQFLVGFNSDTIEITFESAFGNLYSNKVFRVYFPVIATSEITYAFNTILKNNNIEGSTYIQMASGDVDGNYTNNANNLTGKKNLADPHSLKFEIMPDNAMLNSTIPITCEIGFDATDHSVYGDIYSGIDKIYIHIPSELDIDSSPINIKVYKDGTYESSINISSIVNNNTIELTVNSGVLDGALYTVECVFNINTPSVKYEDLIFETYVENTNSNRLLRVNSDDVNGDGQLNNRINIVANFDSAIAEITPTMSVASVEVTYNLAILPSFYSADRGVNRIFIPCPNKFLFGSSIQHVVNGVLIGSVNYTYTASPNPTSYEYYANFTDSNNGTIEILLGDTIEASSENKLIRIVFNMITPSSLQVNLPYMVTQEVYLDNKNSSTPMLCNEGDVLSYIPSNSLRLIINETTIQSVSTHVQASPQKKWKILFKIKFSSDMDTTKDPEVKFASISSSGTRYFVNKVSYIGDQYIGIGEISYGTEGFDGSVEIYVDNAYDIYGNRRDNLNYTVDLSPGFAIGYYISPFVDYKINVICFASEPLQAPGVPEIWIKQNNRSPQPVSIRNLYGDYYVGAFNLSLEEYYLGQAVISANGIDLRGNSGSTEVNFIVTRSNSSGGSLTSPDRMVTLTYPPGAIDGNRPLYLFKSDVFNIEADNRLNAPGVPDELIALSPVYIVSNGMELSKDASFRINIKPLEKSGVFYLDRDGKWKLLKDIKSGNNYVEGKVRYLSSVAYFVDRQAPKMMVNRNISEFIVGKDRLEITITDNGVGVAQDGINVKLNNKELSVYYSENNNLLVIDSESMSGVETGYYNLYINARDRFGNLSSLKIPMRVVSSFNVFDLYVSPNPANDNTYIYYTLGSDVDEVIIRIYDSSGKRMKTIRGDTSAGDNIIEWDLTNYRGNKVANGVYFIRFEAKFNGKRIKHVLKIAVLQ